MPSGPIMAKWDGTAFVPFRRHDNECAARFVIGENYLLDPEEPSSSLSRAHQFAWLREAWKQMPESLTDMYPTPEHLRKRALIEAGFFRETVIDVGNKAGALRVATAWRAKDEFAYVAPRGGFVIIREAESQSGTNMGRKKFQESKQKMMDIVAQMLGVSADDLRDNAERAV